jgi:tetratricopeptide (TPR) repeat protein
VFGVEHPSTLKSINNLGLVLHNQGKYGEAEAMYRQALEARQRILGCEHPHTLDSVSDVNEFGNVLSKQGKYEEAEAMYRWAAEGCEKVFGCEHLDTLGIVNNLGNVLDTQGKYEEAEAMRRRALEVQEKVLGHEHPDTLDSVRSLGDVLSRQGKYDEAEELLTGINIQKCMPMTDLALHSIRNDYPVVPSRGPSSTGLYLISNPLSADVSILEIRITSRD